MDTDAKLFYRKLLDFGPGVGFREGRRKYEEEMRKDDADRTARNQDIAMNPAAEKFLKLFIQDRFA